MTGLLATGSTKSLTMNICSWPLSTLAKANHHDGKDTFQEVWKVLRWPFNAMADGKHPPKDFRATPFLPSSAPM
eukprot:9208907-Pyramimonas_sp.AAC.1